MDAFWVSPELAEAWNELKRGTSLSVEQPSISVCRVTLRTPSLGAARRLPMLLLILHTSNGFNNLGNLLFAQS